MAINYDFFKKIGTEQKKKLKPAGKAAIQMQGGDAVVLRRKDFYGYVDVPDDNGVIHRRKLTDKQRLTAEYMLRGMSRQAAKRKAGYSDTNDLIHRMNTKKNNRTIMAFVEKMEDRLAKQGLTEEYMAGKLAEWVDAKKTVSARAPGRSADAETDDFIDVPDYDVQIKAYDRWEKVFNPQKNTIDQGKRREITFTDWINGDKTVTEELPEGEK